MNFFKRFKGYFISFALLVLWWSFAFHQSFDPSSPIATPPKLAHSPAPLLEMLSPLKRDTLKEALSGDFSLMTKLIIDWDIDAQLLESRGVFQAKRLSRKEYMKAQLIGRQLKKKIEKGFSSQTVYDDFGLGLNLEKPLTKFLPQTYIAATFLLTLAPAEQIVAIPSGLRDQTQFFPRQLTDKIPLDIDRFNGEKLFQVKPDVAFVANYSNAHTLHALQSQGIPLFTFATFETIPEIQSGLLRTGQVINRPLEADLLNLFIDASLMAIDNRVLAFNAHLNEQGIHNPRILYLNYRSQYSLPTSRTLTGKLLERMNVQLLSQLSEKQAEWFVPIYQEQIRRLDPDFLIVASAYPDRMAIHLHDDEVMKELTAVKTNRIAFVDDAIQQSPTQYVILAYYDLFNAMTSAYSP